LGVLIFWLYRAIIDEERWRGFYAEEIRERTIRIDALPGFIAVYVFLKLIHIEPDRSRIRFKSLTHICGLGPSLLFPINRIVHLPKLPLKSRGFGSQRCFASVFMDGKRKIPENEAQPRIVFFQQFLNKLGKFPARWALEIAELFQCNGSV